MTPEKKTVKQRLAEGDVVIGSWINSASPIVAEIMASCGFDFLCVDAEHSPVDIAQTLSLFQAIRSGGPNCAPFVRLHGIDYAFVKRYLDAGAHGVIAPLVRTANDVTLLLQAAKYPPIGLRGVGFCRANGYGLTLDKEVACANDNVLSVIQIEHIDAVTNINELLAIPGVDAVFVGPYDLTASMGITGQFSDPQYKAALRKILTSCGEHGIAAGIHIVAPSPQELCARIEEGYRLLAYSLDITMLTDHCTRGLSEIRSVVRSIR